MTDLTNALNQQWSQEYDEKNRLTTRTDPVGNVTRMEYNTVDELMTVISPSGGRKGVTSHYSVDARHKLTKAINEM